MFRYVVGEKSALLVRSVTTTKRSVTSQRRPLDNCRGGSSLLLFPIKHPVSCHPHARRPPPSPSYGFVCPMPPPGSIRHPSFPPPLLFLNHPTPSPAPPFSTRQLGCNADLYSMQIMVKGLTGRVLKFDFEPSTQVGVAGFPAFPTIVLASRGRYPRGLLLLTTTTTLFPPLSTPAPGLFSFPLPPCPAVFSSST